MEANSQKPKEWVGIANELSSRNATGHMCVQLFKGHACSTLHVSLCLTLSCFIYSILPLLYYDLIPLDLEGSNYIA